MTRLEVKQDILTSLTPYVKDRGSIARRLADVLSQMTRGVFCNCSGWRKPAALDPIRMQALTDAVFSCVPLLMTRRNISGMTASSPLMPPPDILSVSERTKVRCHVRVNGFPSVTRAGKIDWTLWLPWLRQIPIQTRLTTTIFHCGYSLY